MEKEVTTGFDFPTVIKKFDAILERGLCRGIGHPDGMMCIEAAITQALDLPFSDDPSCVSEAVRAIKIKLNDSDHWSSTESRARGLRNIGIAQIGSDQIKDGRFVFYLIQKTRIKFIPAVLRLVGANYPDCLYLADLFESEGDFYEVVHDEEEYRNYVVSSKMMMTSSEVIESRLAGLYRDQDRVRSLEDTMSALNKAQYTLYVMGLSCDAATALSYCFRYAAETAFNAHYYKKPVDEADTEVTYEDAIHEAEKMLVLAADIMLEVLREFNSSGCAWV